MLGTPCLDNFIYQEKIAVLNTYVHTEVGV